MSEKTSLITEDERKNLSEARDRIHAVWRTSTYSGGNGGACVEVADEPEVVLVRDSKNRTGPLLAFTRPEWTAFATTLNP